MLGCPARGCRVKSAHDSLGSTGQDKDRQSDIRIHLEDSLYRLSNLEWILKSEFQIHNSSVVGNAARAMQSL